MEISLRQRISKKTGRVTLYLEFYNGYTKDQNGKRVASGMYLVFSATADGTTGIVTKIAVIN